MMHREMFHIQNKVGEVRYPTDWRPVIEGLSVGPNSVEDTYRALAVVYPSTVQLPAPFCFQGELLIADTERRIKERQLREKMDLQNALGDIRRTMTTDAVGATPTSPLSMQIQSKPLASGEIGDLELTVNGRLVSLPEPANLVAQSIFQDFGEVPGEYLMPAGNSGYQAEESAKRAQDVLMGTHHEGGAYVYNEWDCRRRHYRKDWCVLRELEVHPLDTEFVTRTLSRYAHLITDLRKAFEALRGEDKLSKKQKHGNDVDIDAVVEAFADGAAGLEMSDHLFVKMNRLERDMAAVFMVDMSGSTKGWINEAEREALVLLCESLQVLGDRYAIYGFSGMTRKRCELYRVKSFDDAYDDQVKKRISGMKPQDYTRMGVTIRHLTWMLRNVDARTKLLITLSDGKPDDYDGYRGEYGIEDTRQALIEAKNEGIHPFCITIDSEAGEYLPHMYGAVNYVLVDEIRKLPLKVADIYRKLTT